MFHYMNNAGAGLMSVGTVESISGQLRLEQEVGAYRAAQEVRKLTDEFYETARAVIGANSSTEIAYVDSASRAWNLALQGLELGTNDIIVTLSSEFGTNLVTLFHRAKHVGATVRVIQCDKRGRFSLENFEDAVRNGGTVVALSHVAAHASIVNPVLEIGNIAKRYGATYLLDGCQAVGNLVVDVNRIQCDAYTGSGRKWLRGPRGTGFLFVKQNSSFRASQLDLAAADLELDGGSNVISVKVREDARQFELWERSIAGMLGFATAIKEYLVVGKENVQNHVKTSASQLREQVAANPKLELIGETHSDSGIVGFYTKDPSLEVTVRRKFEESRIILSEMKDWDCPLHFPRNNSSTIFRLSPHFYTENASIIAVCNAISGL